MIKEAKLSDLEEILIVFKETIRTICKNDYSDEQINVWVSSIKNQEKWKNKIRNQFFLIAELNNKILGFGSLDNDDYIDLLYVNKNFLRQGVAKRLYKNLKEEAMRKGKGKLISDVSITAVPFFKNMGFEIIKENRFKLNGIDISNYRMELDIRKEPAHNNV